MRNYFVFDGLDSRDYGVYISGGGTFNAPARRYKNYKVPGRNGALTIDEGVFEEASVVYDAFIAKDFRKNIADFRNALLSRAGYVRMTDSYHPDEFYRARFMDGLDVDAFPSLVAGEMKLKFTRDPRRFLVEGEETTIFPPGEPSSLNLLPYPYVNTTKELYGITWTDNGDGTVKASGKKTGSSSSTFALATSSQSITLPKGTYVLSGCPAGGGSSTYRITIQRYNGSSTSTIGHDTGSGYEFTVASEDERYYVTLYMYTDANGIVFRPMIQNKYGENHMGLPFSSGSGTSYGVTFTVPDGQDGTIGSIATSGTSTGNISRTIKSSFTLPAGEWKLTGCPAGGSSTTYYLAISAGTVYYDYGDGVTFTLTQPRTYTVTLNVRNGTDVTGLVFRPELRSTSPQISEYEQYVGPTQLINPTLFDSLPLIRVTGYGTLTINSDVITIASGQTYVDIDSEIQDCYAGTSNKNSKVSFQSNKFPVLKPGVNNISYSGNITKVTITPRWYRV